VITCLRAWGVRVTSRRTIMRKFFIGGWGWVCRGLMSRSAKVDFLGITHFAEAIRQG
jgi:hypothetical protein